MRPEDLRDRLAETAELAGPAGLDVDRVRRRVRDRRRRRRGAALAGIGLAAVTAGLLVAPLTAGLRAVLSRDDDPDAAAGERGALPTSEIACGRPWTTSGTARTSHGLSVTVHTTRPANDDTGPAVQVRFESDKPRRLLGNIPENVQIVYLKDGTVVGGGPLLREPDDTGPQVMSRPGYGLSAAPGKPAVVDVGPRNTLCPSTSWREIWADPGAYEVVVTTSEPLDLERRSPVQGREYHLIDRRRLG